MRNPGSVCPAGHLRDTRISCAEVNSTIDGRVLLRHSAAHRQTASYRGKSSRADAQKSATREPVFHAVILHCANPPSYTRPAAATFTGVVEGPAWFTKPARQPLSAPGILRQSIATMPPAHFPQDAQST